MLSQTQNKILSALRHGRMTIQEIAKTVPKVEHADLFDLEDKSLITRFSNGNVLWGLTPTGWDYVRSEDF